MLLLAQPEVARPIRAMLRALPHVELVAPDPEADQPADLKWLCRQLFANDLDSVAREDAANFFLWAGYDYIVIQDEWVSSAGTPAERIELAGRVLANWDNSRGNFSTRKIVLTSDPMLFAMRVQACLPVGQDQPSLERLQHLSDPKRSNVYLDLTASTDILAALKDALSRTEFRLAPPSATDQPADAMQSASLRDAIAQVVEGPVLAAAADEMRAAVEAKASVILVEDEPRALEDTFTALTGRTLGAALDQAGGIRVVALHERSPTPVTTFGRLAPACTSRIDALQKDENRPDYVIIVTDILFELPNSSDTGISLIKELRGRYSNSIGMVAYTGFDTPFVAMSAYLNGADYVVLKRQRPGGHSWVRISGEERLLEALAFLCLQKTFMCAMRRRCAALLASRGSAQALEKGAIALQRHFESCLPQNTISLHLQQEWEDTDYVLKLVQIVPDKSDPELGQAVTDLQKRYDK